MIPFGLSSLMTVSMPIARRTTKCLVPGAAAVYLLNEGSGQVLTDYSGNGYRGQLGSTAGADTNDPVWGPTGLTFGGDDAVLLPGLNAAVAGKTGLTAMVVASQAVSTSYRPLIGTETDAAGTVPFALWATGDEGGGAGTDNLFFEVYTGSGGTRVKVGKAGRLAATPECIVGRFTGGQSIEVGKAHTGFAVSTASVPAAVNPNATAVSALGKSASLYLIGTINAAIIYPFTLTDAQIAQNYAYLKAKLAPRGVQLP